MCILQEGPQNKEKHYGCPYNLKPIEKISHYHEDIQTMILSLYNIDI